MLKHTDAWWTSSTSCSADASGNTLVRAMETSASSIYPSDIVAAVHSHLSPITARAMRHCFPSKDTPPWPLPHAFNHTPPHTTTSRHHTIWPVLSPITLAEDPSKTHCESRISTAWDEALLTISMTPALPPPMPPHTAPLERLVAVLKPRARPASRLQHTQTRCSLTWAVLTLWMGRLSVGLVLTVTRFWSWRTLFSSSCPKATTSVCQCPCLLLPLAHRPR